MTDNGNAYRSTAHAIACRALGIRHIRTRPYRPHTNGKAERFIRTMLGGWAYGAIYRDSAQRTAALSGWLDFYNWRRPHGSLSSQAARSSARRAEQRCWDLQLDWAQRGVAQPGSARPLGGRGPRFESGRPDCICNAVPRAPARLMDETR